MVAAKVILDSISPAGVRLTTIECKMHRFVLAEFNTHRMFSRSSASSRAIPLKKTIKTVLNDPAYPVFWGANKAGMSADVELSGFSLFAAKATWKAASLLAVGAAWLLDKAGLHKGLANRIIEPFMWHTVIVTATEWENFFSQRCHPAAQPEMRVAAEAIRFAMESSTPMRRFIHMPYINGMYSDDLTGEVEDIEDICTLAKISVARCARVSYLNHDGKVNVTKDLELFDKLTSAVPEHAAPLEHVAIAKYYPDDMWANFKGWQQYRHSPLRKVTGHVVISNPEDLRMLNDA